MNSHRHAIALQGKGSRLLTHRRRSALTANRTAPRVHKMRCASDVCALKP